MSQATARCDQIISLIDTCLAECELAASIGRRGPSDEQTSRARHALPTSVSPVLPAAAA